MRKSEKQLILSYFDITVFTRETNLKEKSQCDPVKGQVLCALFYCGKVKSNTSAVLFMSIPPPHRFYKIKKTLAQTTFSSNFPSYRCMPKQWNFQNKKTLAKIILISSSFPLYYCMPMQWNFQPSAPMKS